MIKYLRPSLFCAASLAYVATRVWRLTDSCLVFDEIYSVHAAEHAWSDMIRFTALDLVHPPLFYALLKVWIAVGGESLLWLRLLPATFAIIAGIPIILFCRELRAAPQWSTVFVIGMITANGSWMKYSQEVRMYSLLTLLSVTALWLTVRYIHRGTGLFWLTIINILVVWTHYFGWFVVLSEIVSLVLIDRRRWRQALVLMVVPFLSFAAWLIEIMSVWNESNLAQNVGWIDRPGVVDVALLLLRLLEPFYYQVSNAGSSSYYLVSVPLLTIFAIAATIWIVQKRQGSNEIMKLLLICLALPVSGAFVSSWLLPYSVWGTRHLMIVIVPAAMLFGVALLELSPIWLRRSGVTIVVLLVAVAGIVWATSPRTEMPSWCAWGDLAEEARGSGAGRLYVIEDLAAYHCWFATHHARPTLEVVKLTGLTDAIEDTAYFLPRGFNDIREINIEAVNDPTVWVAFRYPKVSGDFALLSQLRAKGYDATGTKTVEAAGETVYLVRLEK